jgi:hypothetical protein
MKLVISSFSRAHTHLAMLHSKSECCHEFVELHIVQVLLDAIFLWWTCDGGCHQMGANASLICTRTAWSWMGLSPAKRQSTLSPLVSLVVPLLIVFALVNGPWRHVFG